MRKYILINMTDLELPDSFTLYTEEQITDLCRNRLQLAGKKIDTLTFEKAKCLLLTEFECKVSEVQTPVTMEE